MHVIPLSATIVVFVYVLLLYKYLNPVLLILNLAFFHWDDANKYFGIAAVVVGLGTLARMWQQASPLIDLSTGKLTNTTASATMQLVSVACPKCSAKNDRDVKFCTACGASLAAPPPPPPPAAMCAQCGAPLAPGTKFCGNCGAAAA